MNTPEANIPPGRDALPVRWLVPTDGEMLSLTEQIASKIGNRIIAGEIEPGAHITEQQLADEFGVSRGPIREAFRILERERLVEYNARRGVTVPKIDLKDFHEIFDIASALYRVLSARLASSHSAEAVRIMDEAIAMAGASLTKPEGAEVFTMVGIRLANRLAELVDNGRLKRILSTLFQETFRYRPAQFQPESHRKKVLAAWRQLRNAIKKEDPEAAANSHSAIVELNRERLIEIFTETEGSPNGNPR